MERDHAFDDEKYYRSGGIRLKYKSQAPAIEGLKEGILLEAGFDTVTPNNTLTISSWALDKAMEKSVKVIDNTALDIICYHPGYTFVEKLQTIATRYRQEQSENTEKPNYMRQYYDVARLLTNEAVKNFIGTEDYQEHKKARFPKKDFEIPIQENEAFLLSSSDIRESFKARYAKTSKLYYKGQPDFDDLMSTIKMHIGTL